MVKKVVIVKLKKTKKEEVFLTCPEIYLKHSKEELGICLNALWNALSKNNGRYENFSMIKPPNNGPIALPVEAKAFSIP